MATNSTITNILHVQIQEGGKADYPPEVVVEIARELHQHEQRLVRHGKNPTEARFGAYLRVLHSFAEMVESIWFSAYEGDLRALSEEDYRSQRAKVYQMMVETVHPIWISGECEAAIQSAYNQEEN